MCAMSSHSLFITQACWTAGDKPEITQAGTPSQDVEEISVLHRRHTGKGETRENRKADFSALEKEDVQKKCQVRQEKSGTWKKLCLQEVPKRVGIKQALNCRDTQMSGLAFAHFLFAGSKTHNSFCQKQSVWGILSLSRNSLLLQSFTSSSASYPDGRGKMLEGSSAPSTPASF